MRSRSRFEDGFGGCRRSVRRKLRGGCPRAEQSRCALQVLGCFHEGLRLYREALGSTLRSLSPAVLSITMSAAFCMRRVISLPPRSQFGRLGRFRAGCWAKTIHEQCSTRRPYAGVLDGLGKYEESEVIYRRALGIFEKTYGPEHYEVARTSTIKGRAGRPRCSPRSRVALPTSARNPGEAIGRLSEWGSDSPQPRHLLNRTGRDCRGGFSA
jgi:hypothetical protein